MSLSIPKEGNKSEKHRFIRGQGCKRSTKGREDNFEKPNKGDTCNILRAVDPHPKCLYCGPFKMSLPSPWLNSPHTVCNPNIHHGERDVSYGFKNLDTGEHQTQVW